MQRIKNRRRIVSSRRLLRKDNLVWIPLILFFFWSIIPIVSSALASFKGPVELYTSPRILPESLDWTSYYRTVTWPNFPRWFANSVFLTAGSTILALIGGILGAYAFARYKFRGRHLLLLAFLLPRILPRVSLIVPLYLMYNRLGLLNTYTVLFISYTASIIPLTTWILVGFINAVPKELEDSAYVDGANLWQRLIRITIPVAWPGILTATAMAMRSAWQEFPFVLSFIFDSRKRTLTYQLYQFQDAMGFQDWTIYNAFTLVTIIPLLVVFMLLQKHVVASLTSGALK